jgi:hypothetical protein
VRLRNRAEDAPQKLSVWRRTFKHNLSQQEFGPPATTRIGDVIAFQSEQFPDLSGKRAIRIRQAARLFFPGGYQAGRPAVVVQRSARLHKRQFYLSRFAVRSSSSGSRVAPYSFRLALPALILDNRGVGYLREALNSNVLTYHLSPESLKQLLTAQTSETFGSLTSPN